MPANPILICAPSSELRALASSSWERRATPRPSVETAADAVSALRVGAYDLIVAEGLAVSGAIGGIRGATTKQVPLIVVAPAGDVEARIAFLEAGADDVISASFALHRARGSRRGAPDPNRQVPPGGCGRDGAGQIVTFFSPKGGVGTTTLAVNSAVLLAGGPNAMQGHGARVLLIDLDLQFGQVADPPQPLAAL